MWKMSVMTSMLFLVLSGCSMDAGEPQTQDDSRRTDCPACPECDECPTDDPEPTDCEEIGWEGMCTEDGKVVWCEDDEMLEIDCAENGDVCGYDEEMGYNDCLPPEPAPQPAMTFDCASGQVLLDVQFQLGEEGCIKGMVDYVMPSDVKNVKFFIDEQDMSTSPYASYNMDSHSAVLELPGCTVLGNLFLELRGGGQAWADVTAWSLTGASVVDNYFSVDDCSCN